MQILKVTAKTSKTLIIGNSDSSSCSEICCNYALNFAVMHHNSVMLDLLYVKKIFYDLRENLKKLHYTKFHT